MKKLLLSCLLSLFSLSALAVNVDFRLDAMQLPKAITFFYADVLKQPFMLAPELAADPRIVSFHITEQTDAKQFFARYLQNMNIAISQKGGVDYIFPVTPKQVIEPKFSFVYAPKHRSVAYLSGLLRGIVGGDFGSVSGAESVQGATLQPAVARTGNINGDGDVLVFYGSRADIRKIEQMLPSVDTPTSEVYVGGYVFEVQTNERNGSGLALAAKLLNEKLSIQIGGTGEAGYQNFIKFSSGSLTALYELFRTDSRFHVVSSPSLRARSGTQASFSVGEDVPVLGNVSYEGDKAVQSVEYRSSGVIFNVQPWVRSDVIDLNISQELSNFAKTNTGVNNSPTLIKRSIQTAVSVKDGDIILIGGLAENKTTDTDTGLTFMPSWFATKSTEKYKTDIVVILQARKVSH
ncbi:type II secretion system protein GspD [Citrobacter portucalensis]|uniref:type II secretion system protein GspD n=1 Tax=Citrobacter portucalensis TaxID=1639133 RepID=UPI003B272501